jgi:DNA polymerase III gamma/tau subunit
MGVHAQAFSTAEVLRLMKIFNTAAMDQRGGWQPSLGLELALAEAMEAPAAPAAPAPVPVSPRSKPQAVNEAAPAKPVPAPKQKQENAGSDQKGGEPPARKPAEKAVITAGEVIKAWKDIQHSLPKEQANLKGLLNSVRTIEVQGKTLILGFASDVLVSKMDKPDQIEAAQKAIAEKLGVQVIIRCVVTTAKGKIPSDVPQDGMVATAIRQGGEIVDMDE